MPRERPTQVPAQQVCVASRFQNPTYAGATLRIAAVGILLHLLPACGVDATSDPEDSDDLVSTVLSSATTVQVNPSTAQNFLEFVTQPSTPRVDSSVQRDSDSASNLRHSQHAASPDRTLVVWWDTARNVYGRIIRDQMFLPLGDQTKDILICSRCALDKPVVAYGGHDDLYQNDFRPQARYLGQWIVVWRNTSRALSYARIAVDGTLLDAEAQTLPATAGAVEYDVAAGRHSALVTYRRLSGIYAHPVPLESENLVYLNYDYVPQLPSEPIEVSTGTHGKRSPVIGATNLGGRKPPGFAYATRTEDFYLASWVDYRSGRRIYGRELTVPLFLGGNDFYNFPNMRIEPSPSDFPISEANNTADFPSIAGGRRGAMFVAWKNYTDHSARGRQFLKRFDEPLANDTSPSQVLFANWVYREPVAVSESVSDNFFYAARRSFNTIAVSGTNLSQEYVVTNDGFVQLPHLTALGDFGYVFWKRYSDIYFNYFR